MNDEQMRPLLKTWFRARSVRPADVPGGVAQVVARLPRTRQRSRWWPLPVLDRPAPTPATDGRQPAVGFTVFSTLKLMVAGIIVALFGGLLLMGIVAAPHRDEVAPALGDLARELQLHDVDARVSEIREDGSAVRLEVLSGGNVGAAA